MNGTSCGGSPADARLTDIITPVSPMDCDSPTPRQFIDKIEIETNVIGSSATPIKD